MTYLIPLAVAVVLFLAMPWLAAVFYRYCDAVNRFLSRGRPIPYTPSPRRADGACTSYQPPAMPADSGLCACCGMYDYKHQEATGA